MFLCCLEENQLEILYTEPVRGATFSGVQFDFKISRNEYFFISYYVVPSILFVVVSYMSFWINKEAVPARVTLAILTILIAINFQTSIHKYIPSISYTTWISQFMLGI
jgi:hypothetical protein